MPGRVIFRTFGVFGVFAPGGEDITPRGQKSCALLAILLETPRMSRSRTVLQDLLWSDRGQEQGAASLRQALTTIRQAFGPHRDVLRTDDRVASLDEARVGYERTPSDGEFLEGIGVRDPEFENWLRDRRLAFEELPGARPSAPAADRFAFGPQAPPVLHFAATEGSHIAPYVVHAIARSVAEWGAVEIRSGRPLSAEAPRAGHGFHLEGSDKVIGGEAAVRLTLRSAGDGRVLWQSNVILDLGVSLARNVPLARLINQGLDGTTQALAAAREDDVFFRPIQQMFTTQGRDYGELGQRLDHAFQLSGRGVYAAWRAYLTIYRLIDRRESNLAALRSEAEECVRQALQSEPDNSTVLAIASLVNSTVLLNFPVARELAERSVQLHPENALGWTFLSAVLAYEGRPESFGQFARAQQLTGEGTHRYIIDALGVVTSLLDGRVDQAIRLGETVHARMPDYAPNLRYLLGAYLVMNDMPKVERTVGRLRRIEPGFSLALLREPDYPIDSLRRSKILSLGSLPKNL